MPANPHFISASASAARPTTGGRPPTMRPAVHLGKELEGTTSHNLFRTPHRPGRGTSATGSAGNGTTPRHAGGATIASRGSNQLTTSLGGRGVLHGLQRSHHIVNTPQSAARGVRIEGDLSTLQELPGKTHTALLHTVLRDLVASATADAEEFGSTVLLVELAYERLNQITSHLPSPNPLSVAGAFHLLDRLTLSLHGKSQLMEPLKRDIVQGMFHGLDHTDPLQHFRRLCSGDAAPGQGLGHRPAYFELLQEQREAHSTFVAAVKAKDNTSWKQQAILQRVIARWQAMLVDRLFCAWRNYGPRLERKCDCVVAVMKRKTRRLILRQYLGFWKNDTKRSIQRHLQERVKKLTEIRAQETKAFTEELNQARTSYDEVQADRSKLADEVHRLAGDILTLKTKIEELKSTVEAEQAEKLRWKNLACSIVQAMMPRCAADPEEVLFSAQSGAVNSALFQIEGAGSRGQSPKQSPGQSALEMSEGGVSAGSGGGGFGTATAAASTIVVQPQQQKGMVPIDPRVHGGFNTALLTWDHDAVKEASAMKLMLAWLNAVKQGKITMHTSGLHTAGTTGSGAGAGSGDEDLNGSGLHTDRHESFQLQENFSLTIGGAGGVMLPPPQQQDSGDGNPLKNSNTTTDVTSGAGSPLGGVERTDTLTFGGGMLSGTTKSNDSLFMNTLGGGAFEGVPMPSSSIPNRYAHRSGSVQPVTHFPKGFLIANFEDDFKSGENMVRLLNELSLTRVSPYPTISTANFNSSSASAAGGGAPSVILSSTTTAAGNRKGKSQILEATTIDQALSDAKMELGFDFPMASLDVTAGNSGTSFLFFNCLLEHTHRTVLDPVQHAPMLQSENDSFPATDPADCRDMFISVLKHQNKWSQLINRTREHAYELLAHRASVVDKDVSGQVICEGLIRKVLEDKHPQVLASIRSLQDFLDEITLCAEEVLKVYGCYSTDTDPALMTHAKFLKFLSDCKLLVPKIFPKKFASTFFDYLLKLPPPSFWDDDSTSKSLNASGLDHTKTSGGSDAGESAGVDGELQPSSLSESPSSQSGIRGAGTTSGGSAALHSIASGPGKSSMTSVIGGERDRQEETMATTMGATMMSVMGGLGDHTSSNNNPLDQARGFAHNKDELVTTSLTVKHLIPIIMHAILVKEGNNVVLSHHPSRTLGKLFSTTMDSVSDLAGSSGIDDFKERVYRKDVQQVFAVFEKPLVKVFGIIGGADDDPEMSFDEFLQLVKEAKLLDSHFPVDDARKLFQFLMDGDINAGMVYREFLEAVVALCDYRLPSPWVPLPDRLKTFLKTIFFPPLATKYKALKFPGAKRR